MTKSIGAGQVTESHALHSTSAWIWLFEIEVGTSDVAFITPYDAEVVFDGDTYYPYPMTIPTVPESGTTNVATTTITVYNIDDMLTNRLRDNELLGNKIRVRLVHADHLSETDTVAHEATILGAESLRDQEAIRFIIGARNWLSKILGRRYIRNRCHHSYGSAACGYDIARSGALATCERTFADCDTHGDEEVADGLFRRHPLHFGGFRGMPKQNRG